MNNQNSTRKHKNMHSVAALQDVETRKLIRARNVVFNEKKVVNFSNESREDENSDLFDVTPDDEIEQGCVENKLK